MIKTIKNIILFLLSFSVLLVLMELFISSAEIESKSNYEVDSIFGKHFRSEIKMCYFNEGFFIGNTNKYGYLGPSYPEFKDKNVKRIALIGDSYVESFQVFERNSMRDVIEKKINISSEQKIEVLNFGRSGFVMADMHLYMNIFSSRFNPDLNLVFFHNTDFYENSYQSLLPEVILKNENLETDYSYLKKSSFINYQNTKFFREKSSFIRLLNNDLKLYKQDLHWQILLEKLYPEKSSKKEAIINETFKNNAEISVINQKILNFWALDSNVIVVLCEKPDLTIQNAIIKSGIKTIDLFKTIHDVELKGININYWPASGKTGHWNHEGHKIIGESIAQYLDTLSLLQLSYSLIK